VIVPVAEQAQRVADIGIMHSHQKHLQITFNIILVVGCHVSEYLVDGGEIAAHKKLSRVLIRPHKVVRQDQALLLLETCEFLLRDTLIIQLRNTTINHLKVPVNR